VGLEKRSFWLSPDTSRKTRYSLRNVRLSSGGEKGSLGNLLLVLAGSALAGGAGVLTRYYIQRHEAIALLAPNMITGGIIVLILTYAMDRDTQPPGGLATWHYAVLFLFGIQAFLVFLSFFHANQLGTTGQVSVTGYFLPLFGVVGGIIFFKEETSWQLLVGGGVDSGIYGIDRPRFKSSSPYYIRVSLTTWKTTFSKSFVRGAPTDFRKFFSANQKEDS
jgi:uncharacterized membrane protein